MYGYVRSRQLEGTYPGDAKTGTWISTSMRVGKGWGTPEEADWPYDGDASHWPPMEPPGVDLKAKPGRIFTYERVRFIDDARRMLAAGYAVVAAFEIDDSWYDTSHGVIAMPRSQPIVASHAVVIHGYDDVTRQFTFANSWGASWGRDGRGTLPYEYFELRILESWAVVDLHIPRPRTVAGDFKVLTWGLPDVLGGVFHGVEIIDESADEMLAWAFAVERENFLDIEELYVRPAWRRRGHARELTNELAELARTLGRELRAWIPHSDAGAADLDAATVCVRRLGLTVSQSPVPWAGALAH
jgi:GNAT superfamily N-acetyltransferase